MALTWQARVAFGLTGALAKLGMAPDAAKILASPMTKRLGTKPPRGLVGKIHDAVVADREILTRDGATIRVRTYRPREAPSGVPVLYLHGGGFVVGGVAGCDHICRRLAAESQSVVVSVEYRLAPEHPFPGPLYDAQDAADWLREHAAELGVDPARLVVAGDSAGGNLAAALSLSLRDQGRPPASQVLIYPAVDLTLSSPGMQAYTGIGLTSDACRQCAEAYLSGQDASDPYASPLLAADFRGLPPTFVVTVEHDPLRDEGRLYAERCRQAGVPVRHVDLVDQVHGSLSLPRLYRGIDALYDQICGFLRNPVRPGSPAVVPAVVLTDEDVTTATERR